MKARELSRVPPQLRMEVITWTPIQCGETYELPLSYGARARYISAARYYAIPAPTIYRSYPVYRPDKEPRGYLTWLKAQQPKNVFDSAKLKTEKDWIEAGAVVFDAPNIVLDLKELPLRDPNWYREAEIPVTKEALCPG